MEKCKNKENEIAHFFWNGKMNTMVTNCIKSHLQNNFNVKFWSYENHYIDGADCLNASDILDIDKIKFRNNGIIEYVNYKNKLISGIQAFSDLFRIKVLSIYGGWWFDTDSFCLKDQSHFKELRKNKNAVINNLLYKENIVPSNTNIYMDPATGNTALNCFDNYIKGYMSGLPYIKYGSTFINHLLKTNNINHESFPPEMFCPIHWDDIDDIYDKEKTIDLIEKTKNSFAVHFYNSTNRNSRALEDSFIDYLYKKIY